MSRGLLPASEPNWPNLLQALSSADRNLEDISITYIQANDVAVGLRRIPVGFYVTVKVGASKWRTSNKPPQVHNDIVQWDDEIAIPPDLSSCVRFTVCASFEFAPLLGNGEELRTLEISVGELLGLSQRMQPISFLPTSGDVVSPCSSLLVKTERRNRNKDERLSTVNLNSIVSETEELSRLVQWTDQGHEALRQFQKEQKQDDLERSIDRFQCAVDICPQDCQYRATVLFNLATAQIIKCQINASSDFSLPITLFRNALALRDVGHPDRVATSLNLAIALASRFVKQGIQQDADEALELIAEIRQLSPIDSSHRRAANVVLHMCTLNLVEADVTNPPHYPNADAPDGSRAMIQSSKWHNELFGPCTIEATVSIVDSDRPTRPRMLFSLDLARFEHLAQRIPALKEASERLPNNNTSQLMILIDLGSALLGRFQGSGHITDLDQSISLLEEARQLAKDGHLKRPMVLDYLGLSLLRRFECVGDVVDANQSVLVMGEALRLTPRGHPDRPGKLCNLSISLLKRFEHSQQIADLNVSISLVDEGVGQTPDNHPNKPLRLDILSSSLHTRFHKLDHSIDLDKSISAEEEALRLTSADHPDRLRRLTSLYHSLYLRFQKLGSTADMENSILLVEETLQLEPEGHPYRPWRIAALADWFLARFLHHRNPTDLNRSISAGEETLRLTPDGHPARPLDQLGSALFERFNMLHNSIDLYNSIQLLEEAVRQTPKHLPPGAGLLSRLGSALLARFGENDNIADIDQSISVNEKALRMIPDHDPRKSTLLRTLGRSYLRRFERLRDIADLKSSISLMEEAIRITPQAHPAERSQMLMHLGASLILSFQQSGELVDLDKAITVLEEALDTVSDQPSRPVALNALCVSLRLRFERLHNLADLDKSILMGEATMQNITVDGTDRSLVLNNLGRSYASRFGRLGDLADFDRAMSLIEEALHAVSESHPRRPLIASDLGFALMIRSKRLGDVNALHSAISYFSNAARSQFGPPFVRFQISKLWITCALTLRHQSLLEAYDRAIDLLPQLAWIGLPLENRYKQLLEAAGTTRDAACVAVSLGEMEKAVELLEQGRSVVWGQLLQLRSPLDKLQQAHANLADRLGWLSRALEFSSTGDEHSFHAEDQLRQSHEQQAQQYRAFVLERERLLEQVRTLPGFERFLLPMTFSQLRARACSGPVIYLNIGDVHGDALIVKADLETAVHIPLPDMNICQAEHLKVLMQRLLANDGRVISREGRAARLAPQSGGKPDFKYILAELWTRVVKPVLYALGLVTPGDLTRVFWCPIGTLSSLPIHAAGLYDSPGPGNKVSDFVISSYIPALGTISPSRQRATSIHLLTVPQPSSDGQVPLFGARTEIEYIKSTISPVSSTYVTLHESNGIIGDVLDGMKQWDWVHFACHGVQDLENPIDSGLCLADGRRLRLSDIVQLSHPSGGLAFLSACQTAMGDAGLPEEAIHLAASMLFAGYESVIGTMWSIRDSVAPDLARDVYAQLFADGKVADCREAASALHHAVERLRQRGEPFIAWVPFIHIGL